MRNANLRHGNRFGQLVTRRQQRAMQAHLDKRLHYNTVLLDGQLDEVERLHGTAASDAVIYVTGSHHVGNELGLAGVVPGIGIISSILVMDTGEISHKWGPLA